MTHLHRGHVFHISGRPTVEDAAQSLVSIPDGVLAIDDAGTIVYCGEFESLPGDLAGGEIHDHRPGFLLPGFV
ncbi:MAG: guanine deaminase, partial [Rhodococcus sp.]|nr:guanine deaminase [Rhodococcus sp. (in: high G+C Gram-positive bacteria)]